MADIKNVASAYLNTMKNMQSGGADKAMPEGGPSFGDLIKTSMGSAIEAQHNSEAVSAKALVGDAGMTEVLQAVNEAELALNMVISIRDRVISAYQEISRTPI